MNTKDLLREANDQARQSAEAFTAKRTTALNHVPISARVVGGEVWDAYVDRYGAATAIEAVRSGEFYLPARGELVTTASTA